MKRPEDPLARAGRFGFRILLGGPQRSGVHPRTVDRIRAFLAKVSLPILVLEFFVAVAVIAAIFAVGFEITDSGSGTPGFFTWWKELFLTLLAFPGGASLTLEVGADRGGLQVAAAIGGLVLPALFVGAIVLKLFLSPDLFTVRNRISVLPNAADDPRLEPGGHHLAVRAYSSTPFRLLNVSFSAIVRFEMRSYDTTMLVHRPLKVANPHYAIAHPHVPYTLAIPVDESDWDGEPGTALKSVQSYPADAEAVIIILISGTIPELSGEFTEAHDFPLATELSYEPYAGLEVDYDVPVARWKGWAEFDER